MEIIIKNTADYNFNTNSEGAVILDKCGKIVEINSVVNKYSINHNKELLNHTPGEILNDRGIDRKIEYFIKSDESNFFTGLTITSSRNIRYPVIISMQKLCLAGEMYILVIIKGNYEIENFQRECIENEKRFKNIAYSITDYMYSVIVSEGNVLETLHTDHCTGITGYSPQDYAKNKYLWINMVHPDDRSIVKGISDNAVMGIDSPPVEHRIIHKDGSIRWILNTIVIRRSDTGEVIGYDGLIKDITKRKFEEEKLLYQALLLENISDTVIAADMNYVIKSMNTVAEEVYGWKSSEIAGVNIFTLYNIELPDGMTLIDWLNVHGLWKGEIYFEKKPFESCIVMLRVKFIKDQYGSNVGIIFIGHDITEQKNIEENKRQMNEKLLEIDKMTSLGLLVSGVAHEINNPNQYILSVSGILSDCFNDVIPILDEYYKDNGDFCISGLNYSELKIMIPDMLRKLTSSSRSIKNIIDELKVYIKRDNSNDMSNIDLNLIVRSAVDLLSGMIKKHTNLIEVNLCEFPLIVKANRQRLEQVVINLVQNACQALTSDNQYVHVRTGITCSSDIFLEVIDNGYGMDAEVRRNLTVPFFTTKRDSGGTGLGLYVSHTIVSSHGGELNFESKPGEGTIATVTLPGGRQYDKQ